MLNTNLTGEERAWIVTARSLPPDLRALLIEAAEAIADGREPKPYRKAPDQRPEGSD